jgi:transposase
VPRDWADDTGRRAAAGIPEGLEFKTKPQIAAEMIKGDGEASPLPAVDRLMEVPGIAQRGAQVILAEIGLDMGRFPTAGHLVSWAKLCPRTIQSGAKNSAAKTGKSNLYLKGILGEAAAAAAKTETCLTGLFGVGPVIAAAVIGDVRHVSRFPGRDHFAAYDGTAPIEVSSGGRKVYRLSRRGNRRLNHAIHMAAVTQLRYRHSLGRAYYDKKLAEGKTGKEALRCLIGGLSVPRPGQPGRGSLVALGDGLVAEPL